jgi:hypothetical protein
MAWIIALWNRDTLETLDDNSAIRWKTRHRVVTNSERSMISKPFVHNMAILAFKKMRSYDSEGRKKSYRITLISEILVGGI